MAHIFKWRDIYRILKNQTSPEIEERSIDAYVKEFTALMGSLAVLMQHFNRIQAERIAELFEATDLAGAAKNLLNYTVTTARILLAWAGLTLRQWAGTLLGGKEGGEEENEE